MMVVIKPFNTPPASKSERRPWTELPRDERAVSSGVRRVGATMLTHGRRLAVYLWRSTLSVMIAVSKSAILDPRDEISPAQYIVSSKNFT